MEVNITDTEIKGQMHEHLTQLVGLLTNLCENCEEAIQVFLKSGHLTTLLNYLSPKVNVAISLKIESGIFFQTISDDNEGVCKLLRENNLVSSFFYAMIQEDTCNALVKSLVFGVHFNCCQNLQQKADFFSHALPFLQKMLAFPSAQKLLSLKKNLQFVSDDSNYVMEESQEVKNIFGQLQEWTYFSDAQQNLLELLTNFISVEEGQESYPPQLAPLLLNSNIFPLVKHPPFLVSFHLFFGMKKIFQLCENPTGVLEIMEMLETETEDIVEYTDRLFVVQQRALSCFNNVMLFFPPQNCVEGGSDKIFNSICHTIQQSLSNENLCSPEQISYCLSILCSILRSSSAQVKLQVCFSFFILISPF